MAMCWRPGLPALIVGCLHDWMVARDWSTEALRRDFGGLLLPARVTDDEFDYFFGTKTTDITISISSYLDEISRERAESEPRPPFLGNLPLQGIAGASDEGISFLPPYERLERRLWIAARGQRSTLHNDAYHNLNGQIRGQKRFLLVPPSEQQALAAQRRHAGLWTSPLDPDSDCDRLELVRAYEVLLSPGELLFIPKFWFHQALATDVTININTWVFED